MIDFSSDKGTYFSADSRILYLVLLVGVYR